MSNDNKVGVGIIGCGNIAPIYIENCRQFANLKLVAVADLDPSRAKKRSEEYEVACQTVDELLANPDVGVVVNLTIPSAHASVGLQAVGAGKHVYQEKPLGLDRSEGQRLLDEASRRGLSVGCAPDTFMGAGLQTCREIIDCGAIGQPVAATAFMLSSGPEAWHPDPEFFYLKGAGPVMDMGPYYLTALTALLGPIVSVAGESRKLPVSRHVGSGAKKGQELKVEVDTHVASVLKFESGVIGTLVTSFDVVAAEVPWIEIYGTEGSLSVPDPNCFGGPVRVATKKEREWKEVPLTRPFEKNSRGVGVADLISAAANQRVARASGARAYHVLDVMLAMQEVGDAGGRLALNSGVERPLPVPAELGAFEID